MEKKPFSSNLRNKISLKSFDQFWSNYFVKKASYTLVTLTSLHSSVFLKKIRFNEILLHELLRKSEHKPKHQNSNEWIKSLMKLLKLLYTTQKV